MRRVTENGQVGNTATEFHRNVPLRQVAIEMFAIGAKTTVNCTEATYSGIVDALHSSNPQFEVGIYGILDEDNSINAYKSVGNFLHCKWVG